MITIERLKSVVNYDCKTGLFTWKLPISNRAKVGHLAGWKQSDGYHKIAIDKHDYSAHRLAWLYVYGFWPKKHLDHIDGIRDNNMISNLREATNSENMQNQLNARKDNRTGFLGVGFHKGTGKYVARIGINGKTLSLGYFDNPESAHQAYVVAKKKLHVTCSL